MVIRSFFTAVVIVTGYLVATTKSIGSNPVAFTTVATSTVSSAVSHAQQINTAQNSVTTTTTAPKSISAALATTPTLIANSESPTTTNVTVTKSTLDTSSRPATDKSSSGTENDSGTKTDHVTVGGNRSISLGTSEPTAPSPAASDCPPNGTSNDPKCKTTSTIPSTSNDNRTGTTRALTNLTLLSETRGRPTTPIVKNLQQQQLTDYEHAVIGLAVTLAVIMIAAVGMVIHKCRRSNMYGVLYPEEGSKSLRGQYARFYDDTIL
ncbi:integumentary mucin C.1 isoform X2 [Lingula anatina]|uniref:Integumentary mucin C.1 isoform X1 n=1 Tax=Lingula anatina TaxID=7574 RepID=A0A1S3J9A5_LINAN|nr:integumentary mucin C.1 isoform X1 [Lingula anatina]XP_013406802.1 integumentary mucin C.1 isoform X2 [Lingula anatina]|eukprot:XP_013406801.1 integumentary mucin C.1 isoform X1 [Lingula anatina]